MSLGLSFIRRPHRRRNRSVSWLTNQRLNENKFYVPERSFMYLYSFLSISNKFCDLSLLNWTLHCSEVREAKQHWQCKLCNISCELPVKSQKSLHFQDPTSKAFCMGPYKSYFHKKLCSGHSPGLFISVPDPRRFADPGVGSVQEIPIQSGLGRLDKGKNKNFLH
jgi:hypothetical protein